MSVTLYDHQIKAIDSLNTGSVLVGGVGTGKSRTAIAYYFLKECFGKLKINGVGELGEMKKPKDLYIITTAKKRDSLEWEKECLPFLLSTKREFSISGVKVTVDSWNNISKYKRVENAFFILDEQRLVGSGTWVKSFLKIVRLNRWIVLSATPGDVWTDYIPIFVANKFYKNRTEFLIRHAVYSRFTKYPKIEKFIETSLLVKYRSAITVTMHYQKHTEYHNKDVLVGYDKKIFDVALKKRRNPYTNKPVKNASELFYLFRKIVNSDESRIKAMMNLISKHDRLIVFYNFDYELEALRNLGEKLKINTKEWNGHKHEEVPSTSKWIYLVQYMSGAEGWNCITTDTIVFYSQSYSYKTMIQAVGRIDRLNTPYKDLFYYYLKSESPIDIAISKALKEKKNFNVLDNSLIKRQTREKHML